MRAPRQPVLDTKNVASSEESINNQPQPALTRAGPTGVTVTPRSYGFIVGWGVGVAPMETFLELERAVLELGRWGLGCAR